MSNPWEKINLSDYEAHMSLESVHQLQILNNMMKQQFYSYKVDSLMLLGIAGGNGLDHISKMQFNKIYGVDVNEKFLSTCKERYKELDGIFECVCVDLLKENIQLPTSELLVANLLIEYIGYECFQKVIQKVKPEYISCIIQINLSDSFVSDSPYVHKFDCLEEVHHQMEEKVLIKYMNAIDYEVKGSWEEILPNRKKFIRVDFKNKKLHS